MFKLGDWVRNIFNGTISQVTNSDIVNGKYSSVEAWRPKVDDWVEITNSTPRIIKKVIAISKYQDTATVADACSTGIALITDLKPWEPVQDDLVIRHCLANNYATIEAYSSAIREARSTAEWGSRVYIEPFPFKTTYQFKGPPCNAN